MIKTIVIDLLLSRMRKMLGDFGDDVEGHHKDGLCIVPTILYWDPQESSEPE